LRLVCALICGFAAGGSLKTSAVVASAFIGEGGMMLSINIMLRVEYADRG